MPLSGGGGGGLEYVDRGDPTDYDYDENDLTQDNDWHTLDLSSIVTDSDAVLVDLKIAMRDNLTLRYFHIAKVGNDNLYNSFVLATYVANMDFMHTGTVPLNDDLEVQYWISANTDRSRICVRGWWKPA